MEADDDFDLLAREYAAIVDDARAAVAAGREPDARALEERVRAVRGRLAGGGRDQAARVGRVESATLRQLERVLAVHRARLLVAHPPAAPRTAAASPRPRSALRSRPTISGNMNVRRANGEKPALTWDPVAAVATWEIRISERPDARGDYVVRDTLTLPGEATRVELPLADVPLRVHLLGRNRAGRLVQRALISALTRDTWGDRWQRRASAS